METETERGLTKRSALVELRGRNGDTVEVTLRDDDSSPLQVRDLDAHPASGKHGLSVDLAAAGYQNEPSNKHVLKVKDWSVGHTKEAGAVIVTIFFLTIIGLLLFAPMVVGTVVVMFGSNPAMAKSLVETIIPLFKSVTEFVLPIVLLLAGYYWGSSKKNN